MTHANCQVLNYHARFYMENSHAAELFIGVALSSTESRISSLKVRSHNSRSTSIKFWQSNLENCQIFINVDLKFMFSDWFGCEMECQLGDFERCMQRLPDMI